MYITRVKLKNWRNFQSVDVKLGQRVFLVGANASGKSNFIDAIRFLHDIASPNIGGLERAVNVRGGLKKIRCLSAGRASDVEIEVELGDSLNSSNFVYALGIRQEQKGNHRVIVSHERVAKDGKAILARPDEDDVSDSARKTQTFLEQVSLNKDFRDVAECFRSVAYLHLVPQLVRNAGSYSGPGLPGDPFGRNLIETIAKTSEKTRNSRLNKIAGALEKIVPNMEGITFVFDKDEGGVPHLETRYKHWRGHGAKQRESEFSDGTLRLIGMFWSMLAGDSILMLEEPEISLNSEIVKELPRLFSQMLRGKTRQVIVSTHSWDILSDGSIGGEETLILEPEKKGTNLRLLSDNELDRKLLISGLTVADVVHRKAAPKIDMHQLSLFER